MLSTFIVPVKPKCPATMPAKSTKVTPSEMPRTLMRPSPIPTEITVAYRNRMCATLSVEKNNDFNHSIETIF